MRSSVVNTPVLASSRCTQIDLALGLLWMVEWNLASVYTLPRFPLSPTHFHPLLTAGGQLPAILSTFQSIPVLPPSLLLHQGPCLLPPLGAPLLSPKPSSLTPLRRLSSHEPG